MCNYKETFKRIEKIAKMLNGKNIFDTKLGKREVKLSFNRKDKYFDLIYYDFDGSVLFRILFYKDDIKRIESKIDNVSIFNAIYEIECILRDIEIELNSRVALAQMLGRWYG